MNYRREIDGLRALAVIPVILFHAGFQTFSGGFVGVDVFFVISGYLITSIILAEKQAGIFSLINFYERRARRILPALFLVMFTCLPFAWLWLLPADMKSFSQSLVAVSGFASNVLFYLTSGYFDTVAELKPLLHTWSLAVEEQYYLLFPIIIMMTWKLGERWIVGILAVLMIIGLSLVQWGSFVNPAGKFFLLPTRGWEILFGALLAFYLFANKGNNIKTWKVNQLASIVGLLLIVYAVCAFDKQTPTPSLYTLAPIIGASLIILFATQQTHVGVLLGSKPLVGVGLISYSAYLWHQPLFAFAKQRSIDEPSKVLLAALAVVSMLLAYLSWKFVEIPFRKKQHIKHNKVFLYGALCSAFFIVFGLIGHFNKGFKDRFSPEINSLYNAKYEVNPRGECIGNGRSHLKPEESCVEGNPNSIAVAVIGDSHADVLVPELGKVLSKKELGLRNLTFAGCPPALDVYRINGPDEPCAEYNKYVFDYLKNSEIRYVVIAARWSFYIDCVPFDNGEGYVESFNSSIPCLDLIVKGEKVRSLEHIRRASVSERILQGIESYLSIGKIVILVEQAPEMGWDVPTYLAKSHIFGKNFTNQSSIDYKIVKKRNESFNLISLKLKNYQNLKIIKSENFFCNNFMMGRCVMAFNDVVFYRDGDHLSFSGSKFIVDEVLMHIK